MTEDLAFAFHTQMFSKGKLGQMQHIDCKILWSHSFRKDALILTESISSLIEELHFVYKGGGIDENKHVYSIKGISRPYTVWATYKSYPEILFP